MSKRNDLIEIRLDRRQTFYAVVGSLLIVSVVFVVGLIIGQRMQLPMATAPLAPLTTTAYNPPATLQVAGEPVRTQTDHYTFYEELGAGGYRRPQVQLLPGNPDTSPEQEASLRSLEREPSTAQEQHHTTAQVAHQSPEIPSPVIADAPPNANEAGPPSSAAPDLHAVTSAPQPPEQQAVDRSDSTETVANLDPPEDPTASGATRALPRRTIRRLSTPTASEGPEDFGYFTVEVGLFANFESADNLRSRLREAGHSAIVTMVGAEPSQQRYRVQVGTFTRRSDAQIVADQVSDLGLSAQVVQEG
ncbi:MAG: SPOR domain-containing protein [Bradymonadales bacterium]|nr:SPOR domain-containing protein [Bradymonadales bacterium]